MDKLFVLSVWRLSYTDKMNQVMEEYTFIYLNLKPYLQQYTVILINRIINADLKLRHAWKKKYWSLAYGGRNIKFGNSRPESTY